MSGFVFLWLAVVPMVFVVFAVSVCGIDIQFISPQVFNWLSPIAVNF